MMAITKYTDIFAELSVLRGQALYDSVTQKNTLLKKLEKQKRREDWIFKISECLLEAHAAGEEGVMDEAIVKYTADLMEGK